MKKAIVAISILFLIVLSLYGWLSVRDHKSYDQALPEDAQMVVKLSVDKLIRKGVWYKITHPSDLFSKKKKSKDNIEGPGNGLSIPANVFFFSKEDDPHRVYASLPVDNKEDAAKFLKSILKIEKLTQDQGVWSGHSPDKKAEIEIGDERMLISYSTEKQLQKDGMSELMNELLTHSPDENMVTSISQTTGDLSFVFEGLEINISVEDNAIRVEGESSNLDFRPVDLPLLGQFFANNWNTEIEEMLNSSSQTLIQLKGIVQQADTITTYEFNDDFEKIEVTKLDTYAAPGISLSMNLDPNSDPQNVIKLLGKNHLDLKNSESSVLYFSNDDSSSPSLLESNYTFKLEVDFESFVSEISMLNNVKFMDQIESLEFIVSESDEGTYVYESSLVMKKDVIGLLLDKL